MELVDLESRASLSLSLVRYEFSALSRDIHDDNWIVIDGLAIRGEWLWRFREPCLLVEEAREITAWLRTVADGCASVDEGDGVGSLTFIEPNLAFSALAYPTSRTARIRVHLYESSEADNHVLDIEMTREEVRAAAHQWWSDLERFPVH